MPALSDLVLDLPPRVTRMRMTHGARRAAEHEPYSDETHARWLADLDRESAQRAAILPREREPRPLNPDALREGALADLIIETNRLVRRSPDDGVVLDSWHEPLEGPISVRGPAPANNEGLRATLRSYLNAREPCDRYDAMIRHAATALLFAERIAAGSA